MNESLVTLNEVVRFFLGGGVIEFVCVGVTRSTFDSLILQLQKL